MGLPSQPKARYIVETLQNASYLLVLMWCTLRLQSKGHLEAREDARYVLLTRACLTAVLGCRGSHLLLFLSFSDIILSRAPLNHTRLPLSPLARLVRHEMDADLDANLLENDVYRADDGSPRLSNAPLVADVSAYREEQRAKRSEAPASFPAPAVVQSENPNVDNGAYVEESDDEYDEDDAPEAEEAEAEPVTGLEITYRDRIFLIMQCVSVMLHLVVAIWILVAPTDSGIFAQVGNRRGLALPR